MSNKNVSIALGSILFVGMIALHRHSLIPKKLNVLPRERSIR